MYNLESALENIKPLNQETMKIAQAKLDNLSKPLGSMGKLEDICRTLAGIYEKTSFDISKKVVVGFAGDHGVYEEGVAADPQWITKAQIPNFAKGICGVGTLAKFIGADIKAIDVGVKCDEPLEDVLNYKIRKGTSNMAKGPAMTREEAIRALEVGIEVVGKCVEEGYKVIGIGEMGIANTTPSSAIISVFGQCDPKEVTGKGAGLSPERVVHKANVIRGAIALNKPNKEEAIDVLAKVGGFEIGAMAGAILGGALYRVPIVLDGFISYAAALVAYHLCPISRDYMIGSHYSAEPGTKRALELLGVQAMLDLDMRLGEGTGGILVFNIMDAANFVYENMATRAESNC
ncbi:nicotinate-nucleotide--dimethylbenzimidazole phosphoribosyltransferase [Cellulosilyticum ruminicola]|uniref:nicotinate-nucleotide--dimethylbenzimidazole phosphoribosyltransferase n=1 Tax=Cellulosilyticum ruminicola TaxID=425254 RepID=UPI0006D09636|nr:nicotinate-nucleotide--dimethylbenzimidazole phosphoribosyltransferase [Cellulosilyticum ruminicola]